MEKLNLTLPLRSFLQTLPAGPKDALVTKLEQVIQLPFNKYLNKNHFYINLLILNFSKIQLIQIARAAQRKQNTLSAKDGRSSRILLF